MNTVVQVDAAAASLPRAQVAALVILAVLPVGMAIASRSAPTFLVLAALVSLAGRLADGEGRGVILRLRVLAGRPLGRVALAFLALAGASLAWGHHPRVSLPALGEFAISAGAGILLAATLPRQVPPALLRIAVAALALACVIVVADLATGLAIRRLVEPRALSYVHNRPSVTIVLLAWPLAALAWRRGWRLAAAALIGLVVLVLGFVDSETALLGFVAAALGLALALASRRLALACVGAAALVVLAVSPVLGTLAERALPPGAMQALESAHARERIEIWQSFGAVVRLRPLLGTGFGTSPALPRDPVAQEVPEPLRPGLAGWHAHNGYLQVWAELGVAGAALAALGIVLALAALRRLSEATFAPALATFGAGCAVFLVSHGAWQGWWVAAAATAALWLGRRVGAPGGRA